MKFYQKILSFHFLLALYLLIFPFFLCTKQPVIILLGKPGAGKGTLAVQLRQKLNIPHISSGEVLKEHMRNQTEVGKKIKSYLDKGNFPPDSLFVDALLDYFQKKNFAEGCILDGFPRTINQAQLLDKNLKNDVQIAVIFLNVSDELVTERILNRRMCANCFAAYNVISAPPQKPNICDICGKVLYKRDDDNLDVIKTRLIVFHEQTEPIKDYYISQNRLYEIDASQPVNVIVDQSLKLLENNK
jgi:adenylate kinase